MNLDLIGQLGESIEQCLDCRAEPREFGSVVAAILAVIGGDQRETHGEGRAGMRTSNIEVEEEVGLTAKALRSLRDAEDEELRNW
jgi:hypothetical protein